MEQLLKELQEMSALKNDKGLRKAEEIANKYTSAEEKAFIEEYMSKECDRIERDIQDVEDTIKKIEKRRAQIKEIGEIVPMKYIAQKYFGKSASWLYQRINGIPVRGKVYYLKDSEIKIFNSAIQDISKKLGSISIV